MLVVAGSWHFAAAHASLNARDGCLVQFTFQCVPGAWAP
jgi:hypothetical protein